MAAKPTPPAEPDIDAIERDYRAGILSNVAIAERHCVSEGLIRKKAKALGWQRDLTERVKAATRTKLVRAAVRNDNVRTTEAQIVDAASDEQSRIITMHRTDIRIARNLVANLFSQLVDVTTHRKSIEQYIKDATADDKSSTRMVAMLKAVGLPGNAVTARDLSTAMKNLVALERQAFNIGEESSGGSIEDWLLKHCSD